MFQRRMFQEGAKEEKQNSSWTVLRDNKLWEKQGANKKVDQPKTLEMEVTADRTIEKG